MRRSLSISKVSYFKMVKRVLEEKSDKSWKGPRGVSPRTQKVRPGVKALKEIRKYQNSTDLLIQKPSFANLVKAVSERLTKGGSPVKWSSMALEALQHAAEEYLVGLYEDSNLCALHAKRMTLLVKDMQLARRIRSRFESIINRT
jgi:histone H3/H4